MHEEANIYDERVPISPSQQATHDDAVPSNNAPASAAVSDASDASVLRLAAVASELSYTLTVGQARELFAQQGRKIPAERTLQHYCGQGTIAAQKIRTTYGAEWLINEASLRRHIAQQPVVTAATIAAQATHDDAVPSNHAPATPAISDAGVASRAEFSGPVGEWRTLADVLIENAKLLATIEGRDKVINGKDETIAELKDDRSFLRDELREARQQRHDVKEIASRMLEAMQTIAIAGKLPTANRRQDDIAARVIDADEIAGDR